MKTAASRRAFFAACFLGALYLFAMSPLAIPDEEYHYRVSYCLSNYLLGQWNDPLSGAERYFDFALLQGHYNTAAGSARLWKEFWSAGPPGGTMVVLDALPRVYLPMYLPQTLGLALARWLRLGFGGAFVLGRAGNALFYAVCLAMAVRLAPRYQTALITAGLLPMAMHQAASFSYDVFLNGMALVWVAALLRCACGEGLLSARDYRCLLVSAALLAPAKGAGVPLLLLVWTIPPERFRSRAERRRALWGLLGVCAVTMAVFFLPTVGRQWGGALNWEGRENYSFAFALRHPAQIAGIYVRTLCRELAHWLRCMAGAWFAGLTLPLPGWISTALLLTLPLAGAPEGRGTSGRLRLALAAASAGTILLSMTVMLFTWTSQGREVIQGVQGRYFLPIAAPMATAAGPPIRGKYRDAAVYVVLAVCHVSALLAVGRYTFA